jgi:alpha-beta hydrolase superfamily lysophospholipase
MSLAVRVDEATGVEERLEHLAGPGGLLYSWSARPPGAEALVVICSSVLGDFVSNYHRERQLGRALAAQGQAVIRFHYTGEGNSQGDRRDLTFESMCADAEAVLAHSETLSYSSLAVVGTRVGALVAAATVAKSPWVPLALWEPVTDPARFIQEAGRVRKMSSLSHQSTGAPSWREELAKHQVLDVLGYDLYPAFVESLGNVDLLTLLGTTSRQVLVARFGTATDSLESLAAALRARGMEVSTDSFGPQESWWLDKETVADSENLISATTAWLKGVLSSEQRP